MYFFLPECVVPIGRSPCSPEFLKDLYQVQEEINMEVLHSRTHSIVYTLAYFDPKQVHFKAKIDLFLTFMLLNFLVRTLQCV